MMSLAARGPLSDVAIYVPALAVLALSFAVLFPLSLTATALLVLRRREPPKDLDVVALVALHRRVLWQFLRLALVLVGVLVVALIVLGRDEHSQTWAVLRFVAEIGGPLLGTLTMLFVFSAVSKR
jgi:hypothetical protein